MTQVLHEHEHENNEFAEIRRQKILEYAKRQEQRTVTEKEKDFEEINEFQQEWFEPRMKGNVRSWEVWDQK